MQHVKEYERDWKVPVVLNDEKKLKKILRTKDTAEEDETVKMLENFVFKANLEHVRSTRQNGRTVRRYFADVETGCIVPFSRKGVDKLFEALHRGEITVTDEGSISGLYTLKSYAGNITGRPLSREERFDLNLN